MEVVGQLHDPATLPPVKVHPVPLTRRLGGSQSWSGCCGVEKNLLLLPEIEPRSSQLVARRYNDWAKYNSIHDKHEWFRSLPAVYPYLCPGSYYTVRYSTSTGNHPAFNPMSTRGSFPDIEADHPPTSAEVKNTWIYISTPPYVFMA
jgi:hypothetical protein